MRFVLFSTFFLQLTFLWAGSASTLTNCLSVTQALDTKPPSPIPFDIRAVVTKVDMLSRFCIVIQDDSGAIVLNSGSIPQPKNVYPGCLIHATGEVLVWEDKRTVTDCKTLTILGTSEVPPPLELTIREAHDRRYAARLIRLAGEIRDVWIDDTDPRFAYFVLEDATDSFFVSTPYKNNTPDLNALLGASVSIIGMQSGMRPHCSRPYTEIEFGANPEDITILRKGGDPFLAPTLESMTKCRPHPSRAYAHCRTQGRVLAVWDKHRILLRTDCGEHILLNTLSDTLPPVDAQIEAVGIPVVNLYRASLVRATWRLATPDAADAIADEVVDATLASLLTDGKSRRKFNIMLHGRTLRITGEVRNFDPKSQSDGQILISQDGLLLPIQVGDGVLLPSDLAVGCVVSATGVCILETESWGNASLFPAIRSCSLVLRTDDDLKILRQPPWWTPARVRILVSALLSCIALAAVWIILLRRLAEQRGRTLAKESVAHAEASLKVYERSRLAVELHDTISQNLTGAVWQIRSARPFYKGDDGQPNHLDIALKTIDSCRGELKNCIWDLRNDALEKTEVDEAIRLTLRPVITDPALGVRFNVPRERLTDTTLHTILSVIREFASNGIRHGKATEIRVAGAIEGDKLLFSVRDNGCGFVPSEAPGMDDGHFGLQGVRERLRPLGGTLTVDSQPGRGCKCTVSIDLPQPSHS